jgi:ribonuclease BN (tRNA processing enzyme)
MTELEFSFIGSGNAFAPGGLCWNGFLVDRRFLFEAPPQALMSLNRMGVGVDDVETVLLSHHHGDHFLGLPFLLLQWKHMGRTKPVRIVGPPETEQIARQVCERTSPTLFDSPVEIEWVVAKPGETLRLGDLVVEPVEVKHDRKLNLNLGYGCELAGRRFAYSGDSALCDGVLDLARSASVFVSECSSRAEQMETHMNLRDDMPLVRAAMQPDAELLLTHLGDDVRDTAGLAKTRIVADFETYRL